MVEAKSWLASVNTVPTFLTKVVNNYGPLVQCRGYLGDKQGPSAGITDCPFKKMARSISITSRYWTIGKTLKPVSEGTSAGRKRLKQSIYFPNFEKVQRH